MYTSLSVLVAAEDLPEGVELNKTLVVVGDLRLYRHSSGAYFTVISIGSNGEQSEGLVKALEKIDLKYQVRIDAMLPLEGSFANIAEGEYLEDRIKVQVWKLDPRKYTDMLVNAKEPVLSIKLIGDDINSAIVFYRLLLEGRKKPLSSDSQ